MPPGDDNFEQVYAFMNAAIAAGLYDQETGVFSGAGLPGSDPHVVGKLWNSSGAVHVSAG